MSAPLLVGVTLVNRLSTIGSQLAVGFFLTPNTVGQWAVVSGWATILCLAQAGDFARLTLQSTASERVKLDQIFLRWLCVGWIISCLAAVLFGLHLVGECYPALLVVTGMSLMRILANRQLTELSWADATGRIAWANGAEGSSRASVLILTAWAGFGVWSFVLSEACALAASLIVSRNSVSQSQTEYSRSWRLPRALWIKIFLTSCTCLLVAAELNLVPVLLARALDTNTAGSYFFAFRLAGQIPVLLLPVMLYQALPAIIRLREDLDACAVVRKRWLVRFGLLAGGLGLAAAVIGPPMMRLVWGERWAQAAEFLRILGFTLAFRTVFSFGKAQLEAIGAFASIFIISLIDVTIIAGLLLSFKHLGLTATELVIALAFEAACLAGTAEWCARRRWRSFTSVGESARSQ